ncbi:MAG: DUF3667 domain-containing protein [Bacteroidota bacterium]
MPDHKFCSTCGQSTHNPIRITLGHIFHEVVHVVTHTDKGFFFLIKELVVQPGKTIKEFLSGKRKKYFSPFSFFFIIIGLYVLSNSIFKPFNATVLVENSTEQVKYPANLKTEKQKEKYERIMARRDRAMTFMNTRTNLVLCVSTPFIAFIMFLMFKRKMFYAEHLVVMMFVNAFLILITLFVFSPLMVLTSNSILFFSLIPIMLLVHIAYIAVVYHSVLELDRSFKGYFKALGAATVAVGSWLILSMLIISGYIMFEVLKTF